MASIAAMALGPLFASSVRAQARSPKKHHVEIRDFSFTPEVLEVKPGDTITWTNQDIAPHTATALDNSWNTGSITKGMSKEMLVTTKFSPHYFCRFHPAMKARLG
jgi:plastocyanin